MKAYYCILFIIFTSATALEAAEFSFPYTTNFEEAKKQAQKENKPIFVGRFAAWCGHCKQMKQKVLTDPLFGRFVKDELIAVIYEDTEMDSLPDNEKAMFKELVATYELKGFPRILVLKPDGSVVLNNAGYKGATAEEVVEVLKERLGLNKKAEKSSAIR